LSDNIFQRLLTEVTWFLEKQQTVPIDHQTGGMGDFEKVTQMLVGLHVHACETVCGISRCYLLKNRIESIARPATWRPAFDQDQTIDINHLSEVLGT
jgi:hypothetical protein